MSSDRKRIVEVRMMVIVFVDLTKPGLTEALAAAQRQPSSIAHVISAEVASNLESVSYVESVIVQSSVKEEYP
jgi:hypothetical protein